MEKQKYDVMMSEDDEVCHETCSHHVTSTIAGLETVLFFVALIIWIIIAVKNSSMATISPYEVSLSTLLILFLGINVGLITSVFSFIGTRKEIALCLVPSIIYHLTVLMIVEACYPITDFRYLDSLAYNMVCLPFFINRTIQIRNRQAYKSVKKISNDEMNVELKTINTQN